MRNCPVLAYWTDLAIFDGVARATNCLMSEVAGRHRARRVAFEAVTLHCAPLVAFKRVETRPGTTLASREACLRIDETFIRPPTESNIEEARELARLLTRQSKGISLQVREGDVVKLGDVLVELDCIDQEAAFSQARARIGAGESSSRPSERKLGVTECVRRGSKRQRGEIAGWRPPRSGGASTR